MAAPDTSLPMVSEQLQSVRDEIGKVIVGHEDVVEGVLTALISGGHVLLEGVPGLGKTTLLRTLGEAMHLNCSRIQFTPDLMPADILGSMVMHGGAAGERALRFEPGPIFANLVLADEINRATPRTQSALLEAMQERTVTTGNETHGLENPFLVMATQNPLEMEGTYPLPEAQLDRFMFMIKVDYPTKAEEFEIMKTYTGAMGGSPEPVLDGKEIIDIQKAIRTVPVADHVMEYAEQLVRSTRPGREEALDLCNKWLTWGAGPRAGLALILAAKAHALLHGQSHVGCSNVAAVAPPIFRHRIIPNFAAQSEGHDADSITGMILEAVDQNDFKA